MGVDVLPRIPAFAPKIMQEGEMLPTQGSTYTELPMSLLLLMAGPCQLHEAGMPRKAKISPSGRGWD